MSDQQPPDTPNQPPPSSPDPNRGDQSGVPPLPEKSQETRKAPGKEKSPSPPHVRPGEEGVITVSENGLDHYELAMWESFDTLCFSGSTPWLWSGYLPLGKVTLLEGPSGSGKSFLALDIAARVSRGAPWPGRMAGPQLAFTVLLVCGQDNLEDTVQPRLEALRANFDRLTYLNHIRTWKFGGPRDNLRQRRLTLPAGLAHLEERVRADDRTRLVVIDPLSEFCAGARQTAETLRSLEELAERCRIAVIVVARRSGRNSPVGFSRSILAPSLDAARCVYQVLDDPTDKTHVRRYLLPARFNFGPEPEAIPFSIVSGKLVWREPEQTSAGLAALREPIGRDAPVLREVSEWLRELLSMQDEPVRSIYKQAGELGFSKITVRRARTLLGVRTREQRELGTRTYYWTCRGNGSDADFPGPTNGPPSWEGNDAIAAALKSGLIGQEFLKQILRDDPRSGKHPTGQPPADSDPSPGSVPPSDDPA